MKISPSIFCVVAMTTIGAHRASAMNWEGHDDWLESQSHGQILRRHMPQPLPSKFVTCDDAEARLLDNPYEQRPLPGKNCFSSDISEDEFDRDNAPEKK